MSDLYNIEFDTSDPELYEILMQEHEDHVDEILNIDKQ